MRNRLLNSITALAAVTLVSTAPSVQAQGAGCEIPLLVQQGAVPANVLMIIDSSGSMNTHIFHPDYNDSQTYAGPFDRNDMYYYDSATDAPVGPSHFDAAQAATPTFVASESANGVRGEYLGNYLNWIFFHADDAQRAAIPTDTRLETAMVAAKAVIDQSTNMRYGLMKFDGDTGGALLAPIGATNATLHTAIDGISGGGYTPSAETLLDAWDYYQMSGGGAPITAECQENFVIFVTDGYPTRDLNVPAWIGDQDGDGNDPGDCASIGNVGSGSDCSDWMDDVAYYMARHDARNDMDGDQVVYTYTIGFGIDAPLMEDTAVNGLGQYNIAWDLQSLVDAFNSISTDIVQRISAGAAVAVVSTETGDDNHLYRGKFLPGQWQGFLEAFELPYSNGQPSIWEAGEELRLRSASTREIKTIHEGSVISFDQNNAADLMDELAVASESEAIDVINYARGEHVDGYRNRGGWKLGDLVYSTPVVVGAPTLFMLTESYQSFLQANLNRERMIYVGSNSGPLHAFRASDGKELWAYMPTAVMSNLQALMDQNYCRKAFTDLTPTVHDIYMNGSWKTILFGGERTGGDSYFAIDITNPYSPQPMWEVSYPILGTSFTQTAVVRTPSYTALWSGSAPDVGGNAYVNLMNAETGQLIVATFLMSTSASTNMCGEAVPVDMDFDGFHDYVYQGDLAGNLWKFERVAGDSWVISALFETGGKPIQTRPSLTAAPGGALMVYFGTGQYLEPADLTSSNQQSFFAVRDDMVPGSSPTYSSADLANQSSNIADVAGTQGWFFDLNKSSRERVTEPAVTIEGVTYFTSFAPDNTACAGGGESWVYGVNYLNGAHMDGENESSSTSDRGEELGDGVASRAVVSLGDGSLIIQTSDSRLNINDLSIPPQTMLVRSWREQVNAGNVQQATEADPQGGQ